MVTTDILVVGAGPTGLALAVTLAAAGHHVTVVDRQAEGQNTSRAAVVHARTLEVLAPLGVADLLVPLGIPAGRFAVRDRDRVLLPVDFTRLPTPYPYTLMVSQATTEQVLLDRLESLGGKVLRPVTLTDLTQDATGVTAILADGETLRARYVVGADGMHSAVRDRAGIGFTGGTYGESFALADVRLAPGASATEVVLFFSRAGILVLAPLPGDHFRIVATVDEAPEMPDVAFVQALLDARGPRRAPLVVEEVLWGSRFRVHHRVADTFRAGRVLLAGDAAHVHSPAGGQGMNTGIQDGVALGTALAAVLGGAGEEVLDGYAVSRRAVAEQVVGLAGRLTRLGNVGPGWRGLRNVLLRAVAVLPPVRRALAWRLSGLVYR